MAATPYVPVSFTSEQVTQQKLQQMANNDQWLFENAAKIRYNAAGIVRDTQVKIIAGKSPYPAVPDQEATSINIYFGSFFSASCKPIVVATVDPTYGRKLCTINSLSDGAETDYRGFRAHIWAKETAIVPDRLNYPGFVHWIAVGY